MALSEHLFFFSFLATKMQKFAKCFGKHLAEFEKGTVSPVIFPLILKEFLLIWQEFLLGAPFSSLKFEPAKSILSQKHLLTQYMRDSLCCASYLWLEKPESYPHAWHQKSWEIGG